MRVAQRFPERVLERRRRAQPEAPAGAAHHVRRLAHRLGASGEHHRATRPAGSAAPPCMTASKPEPHSRFTVTAGVSIGRPARRPTWRAR